MPDVFISDQRPPADYLHRADVLVCGGTGCHSSKSHQVVQELQAEIGRRGLGDEVRIVPTGCRGFCAMGPVVMIYPEEILYCQVQAGGRGRAGRRDAAQGSRR